MQKRDVILVCNLLIKNQNQYFIINSMDSLSPPEIWITPIVHLQLTSQTTSDIGLLYGARLSSHIEVTHFLQYPSDDIERKDLDDWQINYEKGLKKHQDKQKVGWYLKCKKQKIYEEIQTCKSYQKYIEQSFFLVVDKSLELPYRAYRIKKSFINRKNINPFYQLIVRIKGPTELEGAIFNVKGAHLELSQDLYKKQQTSAQQQYALFLPEVKKIPVLRMTLIEDQFNQYLSSRLTEKNLQQKMQRQEKQQKMAEDLLSELWGDTQYQG